METFGIAHKTEQCTGSRFVQHKTKQLCTLLLKFVEFHNQFVLSTITKSSKVKNSISSVVPLPSSTVPSRSPGNLAARFACDRYELEVLWTALPQKYINGRLQGYKMLLFQRNALYKGHHSVVRDVDVICTT